MIFIDWIVFILLHQKINLNLTKKCRNKAFCGIAWPTQKSNRLEFNQYMKSDKIPYIIYADVKFLMKKIDSCKNNPEKS